jgi:hypothetical protein
MKIPLAAALAVAVCAPAARASIYGTMSNFDIYNETETPSYGAEIELEGVHPEDISRFFPAHYDSKSVSFYDDGFGHFGVRVVYSGYNFNGANVLPPTVGQSTNGHTCVNTPGCEHFGFSTVGQQPTASNFYWLDSAGNRIGNAPQQVPSPGWVYQPPAGGGDAVLIARVEPVEVHAQRPDSLWMKVYKTKLNRAVDLAELMSGNPISPESIDETESEWELLEEGVMDEKEDRIDEDREDTKAIVRRYEYFEYTGPYDEENEAVSVWDGNGDPPVDELGQFISANIVAANLAPPDRVYGDFNGDGIVNAADYTVWRDDYGQEDEHRADGDDNGLVDDDDHHVWANGYGRSLNDNGGNGGGGNGGLGVPEPSTALMSLILAGAALRRRR